MARYLFGGTAADVAEDIEGARVPGAEGTVWSGISGDAIQLTDLLTVDGIPTASLTSNAEGMVGHFYGPDNVTLVYVDFGAGRVAMVPVNTSTDLANHLNADDPHGAKADALAEFNAQRGAANGIATLDALGKLTASQMPSSSGGGAAIWTSVKDAPYRAVGDGVADDTNAIQSAINAVGIGGVVYFPKGVYKISATLDLPRGVTLQGSHSNLMVGPGMTDTDFPCYIQAAPTLATGSMIQIIGDADGTHPAINGEQRLYNIMLDGSKVTTGTLDGISAKGNVQNVVLRDVCIRKVPHDGITASANAAGEWPYSWRLHSVMVDNVKGAGAIFERNTDLTLDDCQVIGSGFSGFKLINCANTIVSNCRAEWNAEYGFHITGAWGNWPGSGSMTMTGCSTDRNGWDGVRVDSTGNGAILIQGLMTRRDGRNGGPGGGGYAGLKLGNQSPVVVNGVTCYVGTDDGGTANTSPQYGVRIGGARDVQIDNAYLHGASAGLYDEGNNNRVVLGKTVTTVRGNNYSEDRQPRSRKGVYIPEGWGQTWNQAKAEALQGGKARVAVVGDSLSQGYFASDLHRTSWVGLTRAALQEAYGDGGSGFFSVSRSDEVMSAQAEAITAWEANNSILTTTGTWTVGPQNFGPGITFFSSTNTATATFKVTGTTLKIYTISGAAPRAGFTYSIDGGAPVAVTVPITVTLIQTTTVNGLSAGEHTVTIAWNGASAGDPLYLCGVAGENSSGVVVDNLARAGTRTTHWSTGSALNADWNGGVSYPADLVVCSLGLNDAVNSVTGDEWLTNMHVYLQEVRAVDNGSTDILLIMQHQGNWGDSKLFVDYEQKARGLAETYGAALLDLWAIGRNSYDYWSSLGYWGQGAVVGQPGTDNVHASDAGHQFISTQVIPLLMG